MGRDGVLVVIPREWLHEAKENCSGGFEVFLVGTKRDALVRNDVRYDRVIFDTV